VIPITKDGRHLGILDEKFQLELEKLEDGTLKITVSEKDICPEIPLYPIMILRTKHVNEIPEDEIIILNR